VATVPILALKPASRDARSLCAIALGVLAGACALGAALALLRQQRTNVAPAVVALAASTLPEASSEPSPDWCAAGFDAIPGDACLAISPVGHAAQPLVVYLHGRYARTAAGEEAGRQTRLAARAGARGFAVLALRGRLGGCSDPELADWYCWPSNEHNADMASAVVASWAEALSTARDRTAAPRPFLLGFSNGGYFAGLIASRGLVDVEALAVAHAGPVDPVRPLRETPPVLLLSADDDVAQDDMIRYEAELVRERWPHDSYARAGGHGLTDEDIDAALAFFSRAKESLPLVPPLPLHRPVRHVRDAAVEDEAAAPLPLEDASHEPLAATVSDDD
jgi:pimeloyl-ACP methyl ester carboxylesterase